MDNYSKRDKLDKNFNKLVYEKSPYLQQHANNPVNWYPWGEEAFNKAKLENKPIFLSIGYSTCHWCHVMAHESFEDEEIAKILNNSFISIKVDREERPDIDKIYMDVCQIMTGSGGWPLTIVMTPDKRPFFAGTYFPKKSKFGRIGLLELLPKLKDIWDNQRENINDSVEKVIYALKSELKIEKGEELSENILHSTFDDLSISFDNENGGFGRAPKFPTPHVLRFLLRYWKRYNSDYALYMVEKTLQSMRNGGIFDHIGFGFHRYSTDGKWLIPHFEKMLYDQALIALAYIETFQATGNNEYKKVAEEIFEYVLRDMKSPEGGFYSAEDADSEGIEGKFYLWKESEIRNILQHDDAEFFIRVFNIEKNGNYIDLIEGKKLGNNIPYLRKPISKLIIDLNINKDEFELKINKIRKILFKEREKRIQPHKDDKILVDWNGLMIAALAKGAHVFNNSKFLEAAIRAVDFVYTHLITDNNRLLHRYHDGQANIKGNMSDYAFLIWGLIELYEASFNSDYLIKALDLNEILIEHFWDNESGGFYFIPDDGEELLVRQKEIYDGAIPSGNSVAMLNLLRLSKITMNNNYETKAHEILKTFNLKVKKSPTAFTQLLIAVDFSIGPVKEIVIAGKKEESQNMLNIIRKSFIPNKILLFNPSEEQSPTIHQIAKFTKNQKCINNKPTVYICSNYSCKQPITELKELENIIK
ncbi:MAG: thioredoxin domain-containing protein [Candidatus Helarchaeota archaeon]